MLNLTNLYTSCDFSRSKETLYFQRSVETLRQNYYLVQFGFNYGMRVSRQAPKLGLMFRAADVSSINDSGIKKSLNTSKKTAFLKTLEEWMTKKRQVL